MPSEKTKLGTEVMTPTPDEVLTVIENGHGNLSDRDREALESAPTLPFSPRPAEVDVWAWAAACEYDDSDSIPHRKLDRSNKPNINLVPAEVGSYTRRRRIRSLLSSGEFRATMFTLLAAAGILGGAKMLGSCSGDNGKVSPDKPTISSSKPVKR